MTVIKPASRFNRASWANGRLYVPVPESGLNVLDGDTLRPLPGTQALGSELGLVVLPYDERRLLRGDPRPGAVSARRRHACCRSRLPQMPC